jgi:DNA-binding MarR family transcriptional regulator
MRTITQADLAVRLRLAIARTARRLRQEAGEELSPSQTAALATIDRHGPLTPSELAVRERIQRPTVTRIVARLEEGGLVQRTRDPQDGRSSLVALTPTGRELLARGRTRKDAYLARRLRELDADERATLQRAAAILERLLEEGGRR